MKLYSRDVLQRNAKESGLTKPLPHGWKGHFEAEVLGRSAEDCELPVADQRGE